MKLCNQRIILRLVVLADIAGLLYLGGLAFLPIKTLVVTSPVEVLNPSLHAGEVVQLKIRYCKYVAINSSTIKTLVGEVTYPLPSIPGDFPKGCGTAVSRTTIVPVGVAPGKYHLNVSVSYQVNLFRTETVRYRTQDFTVLAPEKPPMPIEGVDKPTGVAPTLESPSAAPALSGGASAPQPTYSPAAPVEVVLTKPTQHDDLPTSVIKRIKALIGI